MWSRFRKGRFTRTRGPAPGRPATASRDLDQAEVAERLPNGETKVLVAIADVDAFVSKGSAIDQHAAKETTTVYTGVLKISLV